MPRTTHCLAKVIFLSAVTIVTGSMAIVWTRCLVLSCLCSLSFILKLSCLFCNHWCILITCIDALVQFSFGVRPDGCVESNSLWFKQIIVICCLAYPLKVQRLHFSTIWLEHCTLNRLCWVQNSDKILFLFTVLFGSLNNDSGYILLVCASVSLYDFVASLTFPLPLTFAGYCMIKKTKKHKSYLMFSTRVFPGTF